MAQAVAELFLLTSVSQSCSHMCITQWYFSFLPTLLQVYGLAVGIPSIWVVIGFVGSIASTGVCYLFPALLMFAHGAIKGLTYTHGAGAALVFAIGAFILVNGLLNPL